MSDNIEVIGIDHGWMEKICEQIGIPLRDHIIVAPGRVDYFSFRKENMIGSNLIQTIADGKEKAR